MCRYCIPALHIGFEFSLQFGNQLVEQTIKAPAAVFPRAPHLGLHAGDEDLGSAGQFDMGNGLFHDCGDEGKYITLSLLTCGKRRTGF